MNLLSKMNKLFLLLTLLCFSAVAVAQDAPQWPSTLTLSIGPAFAMGSFSSISFDREYPAFAGTGTVFQLNYSRPVKPNIGLGATAGYRRNPFLEDKFAKPDDALVQEMESSPWQTAYVLADVQYQVPLLNRGGHAYVRGSVGGAFNRSAYLQVQTPFGTITRSSDSSFALAYGASAGITEAYNRLLIGLEANLRYMRPEFEGTSQQGDIKRYRQQMNSFSFGVSVGYKL